MNNNNINDIIFTFKIAEIKMIDIIITSKQSFISL